MQKLGIFPFGEDTVLIGVRFTRLQRLSQFLGVRCVGKS